MKTALVIGAGPAGLMAAEVLAQNDVQVTLVDQMPSVGRKFLMAGKSGLNLTHATGGLAPFGRMPAAQAEALKSFDADAVQDWAKGLGQDLFTGSTGRVFPKAMKASPLLRAWLARLDALGVTLRTRCQWQGWSGSGARFQTPTGEEVITADVTILAMGGGSWARLGSDGAWAAKLDDVAPFQPANCGFAVAWSDHMAPFMGQPVKATRLTAGQASSRGEWVITEAGIEGGGIYEIAAAVRDGAPLMVDLMPDVSHDKIAAKCAARRKKSLSQLLRGFGLGAVKPALMMEFGRAGNTAELLKSLPIPTQGPLPIDQAISTAGGLRFDVLTDDLMLRSRPGTFAAGEMLDWEAPTGGYLITCCLATGRHAANGALRFLARSA